MLPQDIEENIVKTRTCWIWKQGSAGYGVYKGKPAHKVVYELTYEPIPEGYQLDHLCMRKRCVNPSHLEIIKPHENARRAYEFYFHEKPELYQKRKKNKKDQNIKQYLVIKSQWPMKKKIVSTGYKGSRRHLVQGKAETVEFWDIKNQDLI